MKRKVLVVLVLLCLVFGGIIWGLSSSTNETMAKNAKEGNALVSQSDIFSEAEKELNKDEEKTDDVQEITNPSKNKTIDGESSNSNEKNHPNKPKANGFDPNRINDDDTIFIDDNRNESSDEPLDYYADPVDQNNAGGSNGNSDNGFDEGVNIDNSSIYVSQEVQYFSNNGNTSSSIVEVILVENQKNTIPNSTYISTVPSWAQGRNVLNKRDGAILQIFDAKGNCIGYSVYILM